MRKYRSLLVVVAVAALSALAAPVEADPAPVPVTHPVPANWWCC